MLRKVCKPVLPTSESTKNTLGKLFKLVGGTPAWGLSAPQLGMSDRVFLMVTPIVQNDVNLKNRRFVSNIFRTYYISNKFHSKRHLQMIIQCNALGINTPSQQSGNQLFLRSLISASITRGMKTVFEYGWISFLICRHRTLTLMLTLQNN